MLALVVSIVPVEGATAWVRFAVAVVLVAAAVLAHERGPVFAAAALFAAIALKDGVLVVEDSFVGLFHVVLAGSVLAALVRSARGRAPRRLRLEGLEWALGLVPLAALLSVPTSLAPGTSALYAARMTMLWVSALVVSRSLDDPRWLRVATLAFVGAATAVSVIGLAQWATPGFSIGTVFGAGGPVPRPAGFYIDPNFFATHLVLAALAALWLAGSVRRWWVPVSAAVLMLAVVGLTLSRAAWVALAVGLAVLVVIGTRRVRIAVAGVTAAAAAAAVVLLGPAAALARLASVLDVSGNTSNTTRLLMARSSLAMIADRPVFGTGLEAFGLAYPTYVLPGAEVGVTHPHQVPLAFVAETGVVGLIALVAVVVVGALALRTVGRSPSGVGGALAACMLAIGVGSLFQYFLYYEVAWLLAGLLMAAARAARRQAGSNVADVLSRTVGA
ncbi:MAG: O-antigen ligase family protein [Coriobacteriia bacterium]|nr:O-antigen ligase family protein [Coriobacteriia bacterium]